jgi:hypothetical protein
MAIGLSSNFSMNAALPLDDRATVADITARDAIVSGRRYEGMAVFVESTGLVYRLVGGITNSDWALDGGGSTAGTGTIYLSGDASTDGSWRLYDNAGDAELQVRLAGVWTVKQRWNA